MKRIGLIIASNTVPILLASLAFYMVANDKPYYGWVIMAAVISIAYPKTLKN